MHTLNVVLFELVNQGAGYYPALDHFFVVLTSIIVYVVVALVILHFIMYPLLADTPEDRRRHGSAAKELLTSLVLTTIVVWILKIVVAEPRPFVALGDLVHPLVSAAPMQSFPSLHAAITMALAIAVLPFHKHLGHILIAFSFIVALSRLYVGVHYPFDIAVGFGIGYLIPKITHRCYSYISKKKTILSAESQ